MLEGHTVLRMCNGYKIRRKSGPKREQVLHDEAFAGTRRSLSRFLKASSSGKVLRQALQEVISTTKDKGMHNRLTSVLCKVFSATSEDRLNLLRRFEFGGSRCTLGNTFCGNYSSQIDMASGSAVVEVPGFRPDRLLRHPSGATHMKFHMTFAVVDFETGGAVHHNVVSEHISLDAAWTEGLTLRAALPSGFSGCGFVAFGVSFYEGGCALGGGAAVLVDVAKEAIAQVIEKPQCKISRVPRIAVTFMPGRKKHAKRRLHLSVSKQKRPPYDDYDLTYFGKTLSRSFKRSGLWEMSTKSG